jgi:hypothetical protein
LAHTLQLTAAGRLSVTESTDSLWPGWRRRFHPSRDAAWMTIPAANSRQKSATASIKSRRTGKTRANSTMDCPSCLEVGLWRQYRNLLLLWHQRSRRRREQIVPVTSQETLLRGESAVSPGTAPWANREGPAERMRLARPAYREGLPPAGQGPDRRHLRPERLTVEPTPLEGRGPGTALPSGRSWSRPPEAMRQRQYAQGPRRERREFRAWNEPRLSSPKPVDS